MAEEQVRRKRRRRRRRGGGGGGGGESQPAEAEAPPALPDWQWRAFPVFFAFAVGMLVMGIVAPLPGISFAAFVISLAGVAFGLAHIVTRRFIARRRR